MICQGFCFFFAFLFGLFNSILTRLKQDDLELGELTLTLCYLPAAGRLTVTVVKAINLKAMDINGKSGICENKS